MEHMGLRVLTYGSFSSFEKIAKRFIKVENSNALIWNSILKFP